jgi:hypothetical protein
MSHALRVAGRYGGCGDMEASMLGKLLRLFRKPALTGEVLQPLPPGDGWRYWMAGGPPEDAMIEVWRDGYAKPWRTMARKVPQEFNVAGAHWRLG